MAKKRKASAPPAAQDSVSDAAPKRTRMRIDTYEDVAGSDDEFHINRDKVMLDDGPEAKRRRRWQEQEEFLEPSDEEVLAYSSPSEDDEDDVEGASDDDLGDSAQATRADKSNAADEEEDVGGWGSSKRDYYDADVIETEQDALDEEAEALRIQKKQLQGMTAADYGFDESEWQTGGADNGDDDVEDDGAVVTEILPQLEITERMGTTERLKVLKSRYPEFEPLSQELLELQHIYKELAAGPDALTPVLATKQQAAAAYLASLTMYFALLTSTADDSNTNGVAFSATALRDHPIMDSLVQCRDLWARAKGLPEDAMVEEDLSEASEDDVSDVEPKPEMALAVKKSKPTKSRAQRAADAAARQAAVRRAERMRKTENDLEQLDALTMPSKPKKMRSQPVVATINDEDSDFGEETELNAHHLAEKAKRKKSLRFYTSQIAQKANKRGAAGRNAGGDDDIPHRERLRDRQARLNAEAEARGKKQNADRDELGGDSDDEDRRQARELRGEVDNDDEYYDMVAAKSSKKKSDKKALADAHREAALQGGRVVEKEEVGADGKRAISYAIEKNKGLTPHRKKDVRNPRVKKRKKYDEKKKKLASMKPVYKGGEGRGGYGGELTGIKKGLVRSTKL
ncbi:hypothetical protein MBLNU459_g6853t1 [Dothideomycetes sp. NU459]